MTLQEFAKYLVDNGVYYYAPNISVHTLITEQGRINFWVNYKGKDSKPYRSLLIILTLYGLSVPKEEGV